MLNLVHLEKCCTFELIKKSLGVVVHNKANQ